MSIPKVNLSHLINGFAFVSDDVELVHPPEVSQQETYVAQKYATATFDAEIKELGIMKEALRWDLDHKSTSAQDMQGKSLTTLLRQYHHDVALRQNQVLPISSKVCFYLSLWHCYQSHEHFFLISAKFLYTTAFLNCHQCSSKFMRQMHVNVQTSKF